jgi:hypothetical protein
MHRSAFAVLLLAACAFAIDAGAADPQPAPFEKGEAAAGKPLVEKDCVTCHARQMQGDADRMYMRSERRVHTPAQLLAQVSYCNTQLNTSYFPDDEANVAAYLNSRYYRFKP